MSGYGTMTIQVTSDGPRVLQADQTIVVSRELYDRVINGDVAPMATYERAADTFTVHAVNGTWTYRFGVETPDGFGRVASLVAGP